MTHTKKPTCVFPNCSTPAVIGWPSVGLVCGACCLLLNAKKIQLENEKNQAILTAVLEDQA